MSQIRKVGLLLAALIVVAGALWVASSRTGDAPPIVAGPFQSGTPDRPSPAPGPTPGARPTEKPNDSKPLPAKPTLSPGGIDVSAGFEAKWGSGPGQLGIHRPQEGNPEAPMSFTLDGRGNAFVLDQVNGRIVRYGPEGIRAIDTAQQVPQDLAVAADGTLAVLDRLKDHSIALLDANGKPLGELPVTGKGIEEPGGLTGVFVDGDDVWVEREHGQLLRVGDIHGKADAEHPELQGRPTRDGKYTLIAAITDHAAGKVLLAVGDRAKGANLYTREYALGQEVPALVLLDSDLAGTVYLGAVVSLGQGAQEATVLCIQPADGQVTGRMTLPVNSGAEETLKEFAALPGGGVLASVRTEAGVRYEVGRCR